MTIKELKQIMIKLKKFQLICFNKVPIKLPDVVMFDGKKISIKEAENTSPVKDGYLPVGTQCLCIEDIFGHSLEENEIEISFCFCTYCDIKSDDDIFSLWEFHEEELKHV